MCVHVYVHLFVSVCGWWWRDDSRPIRTAKNVLRWVLELNRSESHLALLMNQMSLLTHMLMDLTLL